MTEVPGREYGSTRVGVHDMTADQLSVFKNTLRDWFDQLRALPPPGDHTISGFKGTGIFSYRIRKGGTVGPFRSQDEFHAQSFCTPWEPLDDRVRAALMKRQSTRHRICFTHGDITPHNILVDEQLRPTGLIDWECAGWMPEYWEYTRSIWIRQIYTGWCDLFG
ncbi:uncharacterized protein EV420DRAFT_1340663 [Desarmillaria tabescens]|uniref:Aminoglycoside phosphotransferase domain-containing protein n=1 Tax=Armillaria tabescens TaxID=1929756 RepID=A0AA39JLU4_ARMTA|nr:uncharacterized protein EV420DRAFT_1340663 [Desarmillaria tabescens]KAK0443709.1 hypothetical protein EV420DRAFT_1340663 [Desarmillaria tabescens]